MTRIAIVKALFCNLYFKDGKNKIIFHSVSSFLIRSKLSIWMPTKSDDKLQSHLLALYRTFVQNLLSKSAVSGVYYGLQVKIIVVMVWNSGFIWIQIKPYSSACLRECHSVRYCWPTTKTGAAYLYVWSHGTKLLRFVIFNVEPNVCTEKYRHILTLCHLCFLPFDWLNRLNKS